LTVRIVTDSSAGLPAELCRELGIEVVPATVHFGADTFVDGVDPAPAFYQRLSESPEPPTTSTPSPGAFLELYQRVSHEATTIISIHLMETKSTLVNVARMAAQMLPEADIRVVDSRTTTLGLGLLAIAAARAAQIGMAAAGILAELERLIPRVHVYAAIPDLKQLRRSGRVSLGQALIAGALGIKPILYIGGGVAEVVGKVRGWSQAVERTVEMALEKAGPARVALAVVHTNAEEQAYQLLAAIRGKFRVAEVLVADAGTAVASHAGAGALGVVTLQLD
jgi:DegV family protein with EDD domain